jgi:hypothetical protein
MQKLTRQNLLDITDGAAFLASGGGGPIKIKKAMVDLLVQHGPVKMAAVDEVGDDDLVVVVAAAGSPEALLAPGGAEAMAKAATEALASMEHALKKKANYLVAIETGTGNTLVPMAAAAQNKIPVLDGAGARRSVPSIPMCTFGNLDIAPIQLVDNQGKVIGLDIRRPADAEEPVMGLVSLPQFANLAGLAMWPMTGKVARANTSRGTVTYAQGLGETLREARKKRKDCVAAAIDYVAGYKLFEGVLKSFDTHTTNGFDFFVVTLEDKSGDNLRLYGQNETLIAWLSDLPYPMAIGPDLICYMTAKGDPFSNADIQGLAKNTKIAVIGAPAPADLRTREIEAEFLSTLRTLGYGGPYVEIEQLQQLSRMGPVTHGALHARGLGGTRSFVR